MGTVTQLPIKQPTRRKTKITLRAKALFIILLIILVYFLYNKTYNLLLPYIAKLETVTYSEAEEGVEVSAIIVRDEKVVSSPVNGKVNYLFSEGERISINTVIAEIESLGGSALEKKIITKIKAPMTGVLCFHPDGWENTLTTGVIPELAPDLIESIKDENTENKIDNHSDVQAGQAIIKIINNLISPYIYLQFPIDVFDNPLKQGDTVYLRSMEEKNTLYKGYISELKGISNTAQVLVRLDTGGEQILDTRRLPLKLIQKRRKGIAISKEALVEENENYKIMILNKGYTRWEKIEVIDIIGDKAFVKGISETTTIVINSKLFKEGQRIR